MTTKQQQQQACQLSKKYEVVFQTIDIEISTFKL